MCREGMKIGSRRESRIGILLRTSATRKPEGLWLITATDDLWWIVVEIAAHALWRNLVIINGPVK
jgi:hypothetical protein